MTPYDIRLFLDLQTHSQLKLTFLINVNSFNKASGELDVPVRIF